VSGLATAFPEIVAALIHERSTVAGEQVATLRRLLGPMPFQAALKQVLIERGVPIHPDVRPPLRPLTDGEREAARAAARAVGVLP
jgi:dihydrodipicolinate synthase/N-acetylneuraminate lyase